MAEVETTREEVEEDKRSRRVFGVDLVREIARMALRKDRRRNRHSGSCGAIERGRDQLS